NVDVAAAAHVQADQGGVNAANGQGAGVADGDAAAVGGRFQVADVGGNRAGVADAAAGRHPQPSNRERGRNGRRAGQVAVVAVDHFNRIAVGRVDLGRDGQIAGGAVADLDDAGRDLIDLGAGQAEGQGAVSAAEVDQLAGRERLEQGGGAPGVDERW